LRSFGKFQSFEKNVKKFLEFSKTPGMTLRPIEHCEKVCGEKVFGDGTSIHTSL
jgi:hypothetical protein